MNLLVELHPNSALPLSLHQICQYRCAATLIAVTTMTTTTDSQQQQQQDPNGFLKPKWLITPKFNRVSVA